MKIKIRNIVFNLISNNKSSQNIPIVFLHGFSGSAMDWSEVLEGINNPGYAIDLIGHGKSSSPENILFYEPENILKSIFDICSELKLSNYILAGYSMGGRAALGYTLKYPLNIRGLILESTSAGIEDRIERDKRAKADGELAEIIRKKGVEYFTDYWMNIPLFDPQKKLQPEKLQLLREAKLKNNITGISNMLIGFGTGKMKSYWNDLQNLKCSTLLITGSLDEKYTAIAGRMNTQIPNSQHIIIPDCGHNTHLERPDIFIDLVNEFATEVK